VTFANKCHSITPRMINMADTFPITPPIVTFTGPIIGSGRTHLKGDGITALGDNLFVGMAIS
jgi:hypothetical protein